MKTNLTFEEAKQVNEMNLEGIKIECILKEIQELMNHDILISRIFPYSFYKGDYKIDFRDLKLHDTFMIRAEVDTFKLVFKCFAGIKIFDLASNLVVDGDLFEVIEAPKLTRENEFYEFKFKVVGNDSEFNVLHFSARKKKKIKSLPVNNNPPIIWDEGNSVYYMDSLMKDLYIRLRI